MPHEIVALGGREALERGGDQRTHVIEGSGSRGAEERLQLRKREFNRIEVGTVRWQKPELRAGRFDGCAHGRVFVRGEIVQDDHIARLQRWRQDLLDIRGERGAVDRAVEDGRRAEPIPPERGDHGVRLPMTARRVIAESGAHGTAAVPPQEVGRHATFVEEDVVADVPQRLPGPPLAARRRDIRPALFVGVYRFF
jgi:hypothetical protein